MSQKIKETVQAALQKCKRFKLDGSPNIVFTNIATAKALGIKPADGAEFPANPGYVTVWSQALGRYVNVKSDQAAFDQARHVAVSVKDLCSAVGVDMETGMPTAGAAISGAELASLETDGQ